MRFCRNRFADIMDSAENPLTEKPFALRRGTETVKIFTRHTSDCAHKDPQWRRCRCRKYLYLYRDGVDRAISAKTRSWEAAERKAQELRDEWDPIRRLERELEKKVKGEPTGGEIALEYALDRWVESKSKKRDATRSKYRTVAKKIKAWGRRHAIVTINAITTDALDRWRSDWSPDALYQEDRIGATTQGRLLERVKGFGRYCTKMRWLPGNPAQELESIRAESRATLPLLDGRYEQVLQATHAYDAAMRSDDRYGAELRALIELMRWSGLRLGDALKCPKSRIDGNHLFLRRTKKTNEPIYALLPNHVVKALLSLPKRDTVHPNYFFWSGKSKYESLVSQWERKLKRLNLYLQLLDYEGHAMKFHSHQLRDTFAAENLLHGTSLEDVSKLLGHASIRVTEEFYAAWVPQRRKDLETRVRRAMRRMGVKVSLQGERENSNRSLKPNRRSKSSRGSAA
jgi:integrase/recombinase XerD